MKENIKETKVEEIKEETKPATEETVQETVQEETIKEEAKEAQVKNAEAVVIPVDDVAQIEPSNDKEKKESIIEKVKAEVKEEIDDIKEDVKEEIDEVKEDIAEEIEDIREYAFNEFCKTCKLASECKSANRLDKVINEKLGHSYSIYTKEVYPILESECQRYREGINKNKIIKFLFPKIVDVLFMGAKGCKKISKKKD